MIKRIDHRWTVGEYTFEAVSRHGFTGEDLPAVLYRYKINGEALDNELYASLDRAMIAAVGAKYTAPRGAGGPGVGTAADWFARMIGLDEAEKIQAAHDRIGLPAPRNVEVECAYTHAHTRAFCGNANCRES